MVCLEMIACVSDDLAIGEMVDCFDTRDLRLQQWHVVRDMLDELSLRVCGAQDEDRPGAGHCVRHVLQVGMILGRMARADTVGFVVNLVGRIMGTQHLLIDLRDVEMKHASLVVVDPDDRVKVVRHGGSVQEQHLR